MFHLTLVEQIDLSLAGVLAAYDGHVRAAARLAAQWWYYRLLTLATAGATAVLTGLALQRGWPYTIAAASAATLALLACAAYITLDPTDRVQAHRASAARLAVVGEGYRALLAEIHDHALDLPAIRERRAALAKDAAFVFEHTAPNDHFTYEIARRAFAQPDTGVPPSVPTPAA